MKRILVLLMLCAMLAGCGADTVPEVTEVTRHPEATEPAATGEAYVSRFDRETSVELSDDGVKISGVNSMSTFLTQDIIYYEDRDTYDSGNPYGEGELHERHSREDADAHVVINITAPGIYRISGKLSAGQIRVDLGEDAYGDPNAVVELILDNADITCTVAPAILFLNVYECDGNWSTDTAKPDVDTSAAGANLVLQGENYVNGSHVARIYKDKEGEKKLWKQDGAVYSYMSMNVYGPGSLELTADNEGLDTELHLTIQGGDIVIRSGNDGINTNEDGVSVTTINGGNLHIIAGLGAEGDGIDSNGYLVINGGNVIATAHPASDAGLDSDLGSYIHGGTVIALGAAMDWAESDSGQVTMNLQFAAYRDSADTIAVTREDGTHVFTFDPAADAVLGENARRYQGAILSSPDLKQGESYLVYVGGAQMAYTGTDVMMHGPGGMGGQRPDGDRGGMGGQEPPEMPEGEMPTMPDGQTPPEGEPGGQGPWGEGEMPTMPEGEWPTMPDGEMPTMPDGQTPPGMGGDRRPGADGGQTGEGNTVFYMQDMVNFFSGLTEAE